MDGPNIFLSNKFWTTSRRPWLYSWVRMSHFSACILVIGILDYTSLCLGMLCELRSFLPDLIRHLAFNKIVLTAFWNSLWFFRSSEQSNTRTVTFTLPHTLQAEVLLSQCRGQSPQGQRQSESWGSFSWLHSLVTWHHQHSNTLT